MRATKREGRARAGGRLTSSRSVFPAAAGAAPSMSSYTEDTPVPFIGRPRFTGLALASTSVSAHLDLELGVNLPKIVMRRFFTYSSTWGWALRRHWD